MTVYPLVIVFYPSMISIRQIALSQLTVCWLWELRKIFLKNQRQRYLFCHLPHNLGPWPHSVGFSVISDVVYYVTFNKVSG